MRRAIHPKVTTHSLKTLKIVTEFLANSIKRVLFERHSRIKRHWKKLVAKCLIIF